MLVGCTPCLSDSRKRSVDDSPVIDHPESGPAVSTQSWSICKANKALFYAVRHAENFACFFSSTCFIEGKRKHQTFSLEHPI